MSCKQLGAWILVVVAAPMLAGVFVFDATRARAQQAPVGAGRADVGADLRERAVARVSAAERLVEEIQADADRGNAPLTDGFIEYRATARRRLAEARIGVSGNAEERVRAVEAYVMQCRASLAVLRNRKGQDPIKQGLRLAEYHLADAEYWLAKEKAGG